MFGKRLSALSVLAAGAVLCLAGQAFAQDTRDGGRTGRGGRGMFDPNRRPDPNAFRQLMADRLKEVLGCTDEELAVLQPKIEKVMQLQRDVRGGVGFGPGAGFASGGRGPGGRAGRGGDAAGAGSAPPPGGEQPQSEVQKKLAALQDLLKNKEASNDDVKAALAALRAAREEAKKALADAQKTLKEVVTVKQEAQLVSMGVLD
jgi:hypothetical protein